MNAPRPSAAHPPAGYSELRDSVAWADLGRRTTVLATGNDAVRFIDNFTTAAVSRLAPGEGTEGFFTDSKGWVLALANIFCVAGDTAGDPAGNTAGETANSLWIDAPAALPHSLREHLEHYHIRERVELLDASDDFTSLLVAGPTSADWLAGQSDREPPGGGPLPMQLLGHVQRVIAGVSLMIARVDWAGPVGFLVRLAASDWPRLAAHLRSTGVAEASREAVETVRIEEGRPEAVDISEKTLPQELGRDARAISFTKGCYLGQETVARIDALGHVNRRLVAIAVDGPVAAGAGLHSGGETVGTITSACHSPRVGAGLGLAIALAKRLGPDAILEVDGRPARVVTVPVTGPVTEFQMEGGHDR